MKNGIIDIEGMTSEALWKMAQFIANSEIVPVSDRGKPGNLIAKWQWGYEVGFKPMASLKFITMNKGTPTITADGLLCIAYACKELENLKESYDEKEKVARCVVKRKGYDFEVSASFSENDAKIAGLTTKDNYRFYLKRMLQVRARARALGDAFKDRAGGMELADDFINSQESVESDSIESQSTNSNSKLFSIKQQLLSEKKKTDDAGEKTTENNDVVVEMKQKLEPISSERKRELVEQAKKEREEIVNSEPANIAEIYSFEDSASDADSFIDDSYSDDDTANDESSKAKKVLSEMKEKLRER